MMDNKYNTRQTLIAKIKNQHDSSSWEEFVRLYERYIYVTVHKMGIATKDVEDICQSILMVLWKRLPDFNYEPDKCKFRTWMNRVTFNCVSTYKRSDFYHKKKLSLFSEEPNDHSFDNSELEERMEKDWKQHITKLALENIQHELSANAVKCFELFYKGTPVDDICEQLQIKKNSAYVLRKRVIERLRIELTRLDAELS